MIRHARRLHGALAVAALLGSGLSACTKDTAPATQPTTAVTPIEQGTTPIDPTVTVPAALSSVDPDGTEPPAPTVADRTTAVVSDVTTHSNPAGPVQIDIQVGIDSGPNRVEIIAKGSAVQINLTDPAAAQEYHLHGYDIEQQVAKGETATLNFTADQTGTFEIESHETSQVLAVIQVR